MPREGNYSQKILLKVICYMFETNVREIFHSTTYRIYCQKISMLVGSHFQL